MRRIDTSGVIVRSGGTAWANVARASGRGAAKISFDEQGVHVGGHLLAAQDALDFGYVQPRRGLEPTLKLFGHSGPLLEVRLPSEDIARAALEVLGLDVSRRTVTFFGASWIVSTHFRQGLVLGAILALFVLVTLGINDTRLPSSSLVLWLIVSSLLIVTAWGSKSRITVGADGVLVRWLVFHRFLPYSAIAQLTTYALGVRAIRRDGRQLEVAVATGPRHKSIVDPTIARDALLYRIKRGLDASRLGEGTGGVAAIVARAERSVDAWLRETRGLLTHGDYRSAGVVPEQLWRIVEDTAADPSARAGAAVALTPVLDPDGRARLLRVSEAIAGPRLRVAIERAADDTKSPATLEEALHDLEPSETRTLARPRG